MPVAASGTFVGVVTGEAGASDGILCGLPRATWAGSSLPIHPRIGNLAGMLVTIDRVGRIVIPKALRVALGITPDTKLELIPDGSGLRIEPVRGNPRAVQISDGLPILGKVEGAVLTDDDVRRLRDDLQR